MTKTAVAQSIMLAFRSWMWVASVILWALSRKPAVTVASTRRIYMRSSLRKTLRDVGLDDQAERYREGNQGTRREVQELASNHWEGVCKDSRGERHLTNLARPRMHYTRCSEFFVIMVHQCSKSIDIFKISCGLAVQDMFMIHLLSRLLNQIVRGCSCSLSLVISLAWLYWVLLYFDSVGQLVSFKYIVWQSKSACLLLPCNLPIQLLMDSEQPSVILKLLIFLLKSV